MARKRSHSRRRITLRRLLRRHRRRLLPLATLLAILCIGLTWSLSGCRCDVTPKPGQPPIAHLPPITDPEPEGVPNIRVRLTPRPTDSAQIACTGAYQLLADGRVVAGSDSGLATSTVERAGSGWKIGRGLYGGRLLELVPTSGGQVRLNSTYYRGSLRILPAEGGFIVINHLDLESYLCGVLGKELYSGWHEQGYQALAIAARTYARYQAKTVGQGADFDVADDQSSQMYGGSAAETYVSRSAVAATRGMFLVCNVGGSEGVFLAQYSSCCGGTVNPAVVLRSTPDTALAPMQGGQTCNDCTGSSHYRWGPERVRKADVLKALTAAYPAAGNLGVIADIHVASTTDFGRPVWLDIAGRAGTQPLRLRADDLRLAMIRSGAGTKIYSMNCQVRVVGDWVEFYDGKGFGHGVGLCQWGAQGKALKGWSAQQILGFYYPGARLVRKY